MKNKIKVSLTLAACAILFNLPVHAEKSGSKNAEVKRQTASDKSGCEQKIKALIVQTARAMGQKSEFGFELARTREGVDMQNRPLFSYNSNVFIVPEGYISNSAARVIVRSPDTTCEIVKLAVSIGG